MLYFTCDREVSVGRRTHLNCMNVEADSRPHNAGTLTAQSNFKHRQRVLHEIGIQQVKLG